MAFNCSGDESGMSEKSIFRAVRRAFAATRPPRADEPDRFGIASSPQGVGDDEHAPVGGSTEPPKPRFGSRVLQVCAVEGLASRKTVTASSNDTPCFAALAAAFRRSHSNTYLVYTEC